MGAVRLRAGGGAAGSEASETSERAGARAGQETRWAAATMARMARATLERLRRDVEQGQGRSGGQSGRGGVAHARLDRGAAGCCRMASAPIPNPVEAAVWAMNYYLGKNSRSLRRHERRPSYTHTAAPVLGPRVVTLGGGGDYRPVGRRVFYCERCSADGSSPWS